MLDKKTLSQIFSDCCIYVLSCFVGFISSNPFGPGNFPEKRVLKLVQPFLVTGDRLCSSRPSDPDAKYYLLKFGHFWPSCSLFLPHFFSFAGHLVGFILVEKVCGKAFRILGVDERKCRWVVKQDFQGNFMVNVTWFFPFFSGLLDWIVLILVWFLTLHKLVSCP